MMCRSVLQSNLNMDTGRVQSKVSALQRYLSVLQSNLQDMDTKGKEPSVCIVVEICIIELVIYV